MSRFVKTHSLALVVYGPAILLALWVALTLSGATIWTAQQLRSLSPAQLDPQRIGGALVIVSLAGLLFLRSRFLTSRFVRVVDPRGLAIHSGLFLSLVIVRLLIDPAGGDPADARLFDTPLPEGFTLALVSAGWALLIRSAVLFAGGRIGATVAGVGLWLLAGATVLQPSVVDGSGALPLAAILASAAAGARLLIPGRVYRPWVAMLLLGAVGLGLAVWADAGTVNSGALIVMAAFALASVLVALWPAGGDVRSLALVGLLAAAFFVSVPPSGRQFALGPGGYSELALDGAADRTFTTLAGSIVTPSAEPMTPPVPRATEQEWADDSAWFLVRRAVIQFSVPPAWAISALLAIGLAAAALSAATGQGDLRFVLPAGLLALSAPVFGACQVAGASIGGALCATGAVLVPAGAVLLLALSLDVTLARSARLALLLERGWALLNGEPTRPVVSAARTSRRLFDEPRALGASFYAPTLVYHQAHDRSAARPGDGAMDRIACPACGHLVVVRPGSGK